MQPAISFNLSECANTFDARIISAETFDFDIMSVYVPAGGDVPDSNINPKFRHKLLFLDELNQLLKTKKIFKVHGIMLFLDPEVI